MEAKLSPGHTTARLSLMTYVSEALGHTCFYILISLISLGLLQGFFLNEHTCNYCDVISKEPVSMAPAARAFNSDLIVTSQGLFMLTEEETMQET